MIHDHFIATEYKPIYIYINKISSFKSNKIFLKERRKQNLKPIQMTSILLLLLLSLSSLSLALSHGLRTELNHIDAGGKFTKLELLQRMVHRSKTRARYLSSKYSNPSSQTSIQAHPSNGEYLISLSIGTPTKPLALTLDTGSDLIWTQCQPCLQCFDQPLPLYNPSNSSTFSDLSCDSDLCKALPYSACHKQCLYSYFYGDGSLSVGILGNEAFTLGTTTLPNIGFGCGFYNGGIFTSNESGIAGFGRGPLSLISQLGYGKFSYCFTSMLGESKSSPVLFGDAADLTMGSNGTIQSTPFVTNPLIKTSYYLTLNGITVGTMLLKIPKSTFALKENGTGGVIIDSGTSITSLAEPAYSQVKIAFLSQVKLPVVNGSVEGLDLCFGISNSTSQNIEVPKFTFHFEGADLELPKENYMLENASSGTMCLVMSNSSDSTLIGNFQQQNIHVLYDLEGGKLSFVPAQCDQL
ncbi:hypothetical protein LUZ60_001303 [Juncus effusus]|nr:hypothetical protein LUZ60_001303 [Juncus effusus]